MKLSRLIVPGAMTLVAGCNLLPSQLQPPKASTQAATSVDERDPTTFDLTIPVRFATRKVQFNAGAAQAGVTGSGLQQDVKNLVVGLFDRGSVANTNASLGYIWTGDVGAATSTPAALSSAGAVYLLSASASAASLESKIGTVIGTVPADRSNLRRWILRDYGTATAFASGGTTVKFKNLPIATASGPHTYIIFAAAYDSEKNVLGYTEAALPDAKVTGAIDTVADPLTLQLSTNVFTNQLSETPNLTVFVPTATLRDALPR